jgi:hypothetical protein
VSQQWLLRSVREGQFRISGPMAREDVLNAIREGTVSVNDEVCQANSYWFSFYESEELHRHLGVSWSQLRREAGDRDATSEDATQQSTEDGDTDEITVTGGAASSASTGPVPTGGAGRAEPPASDLGQEPLSSGMEPGLFGLPIWGWWVVSAVALGLVIRFL